MLITHLSLTNFRNYGRLELELPAGTTLLHGANAQGKTNLLEAIYYLATARSPHAELEQQLINWEAVASDEPIIVGRLVAQLETGLGPKRIEVRLIKEQQHDRSSFRREALVNRRKVRLMDLLGNLRVVLFLPQEMQLVTGAPSRRRRYLDVTLCQTDREYCRALSTYNKVLEQRNALLRSIAEQGTGRDVLPVYTDKLVKLGAQIFAKRADLVTSLAREAQRIHYENLTEGRETLRLCYLPRLNHASSGRVDEITAAESVALGEWIQQQPSYETIANRYYQELAEAHSLELASGTTRIGPHRDDWRFWVSGKSLSGFGSRGQQRSAILALKLSEISLMSARTGETPILLLDEVVAELDQHRRGLLLQTVQAATQAILTATDPGMFPGEFLSQVNTMTVKSGQVTLDTAEPATP